GVKVPDIAHELGVSAATIYKDLSPGDSRVGPRRAVEVRRLVARGVDKLKIAKRLRVSPSAVYDVPAARPVSLPQKFGPQAKALRAQGLSLSAIESKLKISRTTVKRALATDETVVHHRRPGKRSPERQRALKVIKLLADGVPKSRIAKRLKMGLSTVYRVVREEAAGRPVVIRSKRKPDAKRVHKLFAQGKSKSEIARRLGMSRMTVRLLLGHAPPPVPLDRAQLVRESIRCGLQQKRDRDRDQNEPRRRISRAARAGKAAGKRRRTTGTTAPQAARDDHRAVRQEARCFGGQRSSGDCGR
ncbi:MAG: helix-turn-helix domain-containing protein, partial [Stellaceae bacterium]